MKMEVQVRHKYHRAPRAGKGSQVKDTTEMTHERKQVQNGDQPPTWQCPICKENFLYFEEAIAHRCSSKTEDMLEEYHELFNLR